MDLIDEQNSLFGEGITGLKRLGDLCVFYTPGSIWVMRFVGFEAGVMQFKQQIQGFGCRFPYALIGLDRYHAFPTNENFYVFDGSNITAIGDPIRDYFFGNLASDPLIRNRIWGALDVNNQELRWYFPSKQSTGFCDLCVVFNWATRLWYTESGFNYSAVLNAGTQTYRWIDSLTSFSATIDGLSAVSTTIDGLSAVQLLPNDIYTRVNELALFHESNIDDEITRTESIVSTLETRNFTFNDAVNVHGIAGIRVDASGFDVIIPEEFGGTFKAHKAGWDVFISTKPNHSSPVTYDLCGTHLASNASQEFNQLQVKGTYSARLTNAVFRFKFQSRNIKSSKFLGFSLIHTKSDAEK